MLLVVVVVLIGGVVAPVAIVLTLADVQKNKYGSQQITPSLSSIPLSLNIYIYIHIYIYMHMHVSVHIYNSHNHIRNTSQRKQHA